MKTFCGLKCTVTPHKSLNTSRGIVRCPALSKQSCEHILEFMGEQGVTDVRRINVHRDGVLKPTNTFVFTFDSSVLPAIVRIGFIQAKLTCISQIHLDVINVKCLATMKLSVADWRYALTVVCLNIAKGLPSVPTAQVIFQLNQKIARNGRKREKSLKLNVKTTCHFQKLVSNLNNFTKLGHMQVL